FLQDGAFPFGSVLTVTDIIDLISQEWVETSERLFTPLVTLCTFLSQIHSDDPSCRAAVAPQCPAGGTRVATGVAAHWWLLQGAPTAPGVAAAAAAVVERPAADAAGACGMALAWPRGQDRGWFSGVHARHGGEPTSLSAAREPGSRPRFSCCPDRGRVV